MEERHTAENLAIQLGNTFNEWEVNSKVIAVVTDNARNIVNAISLISSDTNISSVTCAAHSLQLTINHSLRQDSIQLLVEKCSKLVSHFKHSNIAKRSLEIKQEQLGMAKTALIQYCKTRWNSTFMMLERLYLNRSPLANVIADRTITSATMAQKFEITESQWARVEFLIKKLKPLQIITQLFCDEKHSPVSMVRPLLQKVIEKHLSINDTEDDIEIYFKQSLITQIKTRFNLEWTSSSTVNLSQISSLLDPRYKDLEHESLDSRDDIRKELQNILETNYPQVSVTEHTKNSHTSAMEFLYGDEMIDMNDPKIQLQGYLAESQLRFDLDPFEWWNTRTIKYPIISECAKKYLTIPATSVSSERCFSTAGNIVTPKRSCLLPENVNT
ncbi:zinc finger BED domain-containing protein 1-like, partial [Melanaphis sacchari]|uniref:zinc finger BED domain-containing protein 1-like n=1 Tax=Melanaphis sacchari TaxID=742174 RepID=UPI000DC148D7